jgi:hypothetical protein
VIPEKFVPDENVQAYGLVGAIELLLISIMQYANLVKFTVV